MEDEWCDLKKGSGFSTHHIVTPSADSVSRDQFSRDQLPPDQFSQDQLPPDQFSRDQLPPDQFSQDQLATRSTQFFKD